MDDLLLQVIMKNIKINSVFVVFVILTVFLIIFEIALNGSAPRFFGAFLFGYLSIIAGIVEILKKLESK